MTDSVATPQASAQPGKKMDMATIVVAKHAAHAMHNFRMQTVAEILAGGDDDHEWEDLDPRAIEAVRL